MGIIAFFEIVMLVVLMSLLCGGAGAALLNALFNSDTSLGERNLSLAAGIVLVFCFALAIRYEIPNLPTELHKCTLEMTDIREVCVRQYVPMIIEE